MFGRPWIFQFGPFLIPTDGRDELNMLATGLEPKEYVDKVWAARTENCPKRQRARSRTWPMTGRIKGGGFVLAADQNKVIRMPTRLRSVSGTGKPARQGSRQDL